eukprot:TRINITY_DN3560_c0_g1_i2.p2 TRINITY_DN3560_c0_g1~~TRINITY_DN3560_c0_g1_i2.p2  ORF type:complete len:194 (-),score=50.20 TRINITY_DN3560_c0_g1_i2:123-704(-)
MGVLIVQIDHQGQYTCLADTGIDIERQLQTLVTLNAGEYYVVPYSTGCHTILRQQRKGPQAHYPAHVDFVVSLHGDRAISIEAIPYQPEVADRCLLASVLNRGENNISENTGVELHVLKSASSAMFVASLPASAELPVNMQFDCSDSLNLWSHRGVPVATVRLEPGQSKLLLALVKVEPDAWSYSYSYSCWTD